MKIQYQTCYLIKKEDLLKNVRKLGIQVINLWEHDNISEVDFLTELTTELKNLNLTGTEKKSLKKISIELINKFKYWYIFLIFNQYIKFRNYFSFFEFSLIF